MHEQDFERSVQKKMEELSFTPSAPVWERVQKEIRARKDRRRALLWSLPLLLVLGGGWWFFQSQPVDDKNTYGTELVKTEKQNNSVVKEGQNNTNTTQQPGREKASTEAVNNNSSVPKSSTGIATTKTANQKKTLIESRIITEPSFAVNQPIAAANKYKRNTARKQNGRIIKEPLTIAAEENNLPVTALTPQEQTRAVQPHPLSFAKKEDILTYVTPGALANLNLAVPLLAKKDKAHSWQLGFHLAYGNTKLTQGSFFPSARLADQSSAPPFTNSPGSSMAPPPTPSRQLDPGNFIAAGLQVRKPLGRGLAIASGLQYARYTQKQKVGSAVSLSAIPSNISFSSIRGNTLFRDTLHTSYYQNRYHQLSIPLELQVNPFNRVPLQISAGFSLGYLFGAKELQYDSNTRLYYETKPELQRYQFLSQAALHYRFARTKNLEILAGPQLHYHLNSLRNSSLNVPSRLFAYSLDLQVRLK